MIGARSALSALSLAAQRHRSTASRALAAAVGAHAATSLLIVAIGLLAPHLGIERAQAVLAATMGSFLLYAVLIMAAFHTRTALRAWVGLSILAAPLGVAIWLLS